MAALVDTSVLCRLANQEDAAFTDAARAIAELHRRQETLHITAQNLIEFRNVATRPLSGNGLGLPPDMAASLAANLEVAFELLPETRTSFRPGRPSWTIWESLASRYMTRGSSPFVMRTASRRS